MNSDLNNMANRYKEEMMRLYHRSAGSTTQNKSAADSPTAQNTPVHMYENNSDSTVTDNGTPTVTVPDNGTAQTNLSQQPVDLPISCSCRFPSAESIINQIAATPMPLPAVQENSSSDQAQGSSKIYSQGSSVGELAADTDNSNTRKSGSQSGALNGIFINGNPDRVAFDPHLEKEQEKEILPDFKLPPDISAESSESTDIITDGNYAPSAGWQAMTGDNSWGYLQFEVFTAGGAYPISGAAVTVKKVLSNGTALARVLFTNRSGRTPTIALPAPSKKYSQTPNSGVIPFSEYNVTVRADGYYTLRDINMPIFGGVKTIQPVDMIPLPEFPANSAIQPRNNNGNTINDTADVG